MLDRTKGAALARKVGAPKTAEIIETRWCYARIFQSAIEEIGAPKLVDALAEAKNAEWAFRALRDIRDLTERHRTIRSKGCLSNKTALAMVFKLVDGAQKTWRKLDGHNQLPKIIQGVKFTDGLEVVVKPATIQAQTAAA